MAIKIKILFELHLDVDEPALVSVDVLPAALLRGPGRQLQVLPGLNLITSYHHIMLLSGCDYDLSLFKECCFLRLQEDFLLLLDYLIIWIINNTDNLCDIYGTWSRVSMLVGDEMEISQLSPGLPVLNDISCPHKI